VSRLLSALRTTGGRLFEVRRLILIARRMPELAPGVVGALRVCLILVRGFVELHFRRLRRNTTRSFLIGRKQRQRRLFVRSNGMDTFTFYEVFVKKIYQQLLPLDANDVVLDLGANIGMASAYLDFAWPGARVIAVEPEPECAALWRRNVQSPAASLVEAAVAVHDGQGLLEVGAPTSHHLAEPGTCNVRKVRTVSLDSLVRELQKNICVVIKCDIEGEEESVLGAPSAALFRARTIVVEVHREEARDRIVENLTALGFRRVGTPYSDLPETFVRPQSGGAKTEIRERGGRAGA
jgi:FkbM family methyltransferase